MQSEKNFPFSEFLRCISEINYFKLYYHLMPNQTFAMNKCSLKMFINIIHFYGSFHKLLLVKTNKPCFSFSKTVHRIFFK